MVNLSYIRLLTEFDSFATAHQQIKRFGSDFAEQMPNFATGNEKYPILYVVPNNTIFDENANTFTVDVYCFDIIEKDRSNINTILSDTNTILNDVYRWFKDGEIIGIDVINDAPNAVPINNGLLDYAAGWQMSITFEVDTYGLCEIPLSPFPAPEPALGYVTIYAPDGVTIIAYVLNNGSYITTGGGGCAGPFEIYVNGVLNQAGVSLDFSTETFNIEP
jgi:hypothetical protein